MEEVDMVKPEHGDCCMFCKHWDRVGYVKKDKTVAQCRHPRSAVQTAPYLTCNKSIKEEKDV